MNNSAFIPYQRLELKNMSTEKIISIIRVAAKNYDDTSLILTPRIDQSGQAYYWTGLRYGGCTELDFKLCLNKEIESFILCFLMKGKDGLVAVGNFTPTPTMTHGINWMQSTGEIREYDMKFRESVRQREQLKLELAELEKRKKNIFWDVEYAMLSTGVKYFNTCSEYWLIKVESEYIKAERISVQTN